MPERVSTAPREISLTEDEIAKLQKIRWAHDAPHPDGGTQPVFGLRNITMPHPGGYEQIRLSKEGKPERAYVPVSAAATGSGDEEFSRLVYRNLRLRQPITVYPLSPNGIIDPLNPDRINEIGDFVVEVDRTFMQDRESRFIVETQKRLLQMYRGYVQYGILDENDEMAKKLIEDASIHLQHLEETREDLPDRIRGLVPKAQRLGVLFVSERGTTRDSLVLDPELIHSVYTPETDNLSFTEFTDHSRAVVHNMKAVNLKELAAASMK